MVPSRPKEIQDHPVIKLLKLSPISSSISLFFLFLSLLFHPHIFNLIQLNNLFLPHLFIMLIHQILHQIIIQRTAHKLIKRNTHPILTRLLPRGRLKHRDDVPHRPIRVQRQYQIHKLRKQQTFRLIRVELPEQVIVKRAGLLHEPDGDLQPQGHVLSNRELKDKEKENLTRISIFYM